MKAFEYAAPRTEAGVLELLAADAGHTEIMAGGTDLVPLMKKMIVRPDRVINIADVPSLRGVVRDSLGLTIGAVTPLDELLESPELNDYPAVRQAIQGINSAQLQAQGTLGGDLCQRPQCWYFRNGLGLLEAARMVERGQNRYHAIFGNSGPAKFVCPSRIAPALIALGARVRIAGPAADAETWIPLEAFFRTPRHAAQRENVLAPNQLLTHVHVPSVAAPTNATYEVRTTAGPDYPLAAAAAALEVEGGVVRRAEIVMGHVAPVPWMSAAAAEAIVGQPVTHETAYAAGDAAVASATPLSGNAYKVQLARVSVARVILLAAGMETGGF